MKYERFEQLPVWQAGIDLSVQVYSLAANPAFRRQRSLRDQIERAAVSISNNIAEGFERGTNQELLTFLYIARGSSGEVRSRLCLLEKISAFRDLESEILNLKSNKVLRRFDETEKSTAHHKSSFEINAPFEKALDAILKVKPEQKKPNIKDS